MTHQKDDEESKSIVIILYRIDTNETKEEQFQLDEDIYDVKEKAMEIFKEDNVLTVTLHKKLGEQALDEEKSLSDIFNNSQKAKLYVKVCRKPVEALSLDEVKISQINHEDLSSKSVKSLTHGSDDIRKPIEELRSRSFNAKAEVR